MADSEQARPPFPWIFRYVEDPTSQRRYPAGSGRRVLRPLVEVSIEGRVPMEQRVAALVDSGSEHTLAAPWVAQAIQVDPKREAVREMPLGIGGENVLVRFLPERIRLHPPDQPGKDFEEWEAEVGFVDRWRPSWSVLLGQIGFFDRFTVTMHRHAQVLVVEPFDAFDKRFGPLISNPPSRPPRRAP